MSPTITDSPTVKTPAQRSTKYYKYIRDHDDLESAIMIVLNGFGDGIEYKHYTHNNICASVNSIIPPYLLFPGYYDLLLCYRKHLLNGPG